MTRFDLIVIGGGPAGSAAAIEAARQGMRVVLIDRTKPPIRRVCGEVLSFAGCELAAELSGIDWSTSPRFEWARFTDATRPGESVGWRPVRPSRGISRTRLDESLLGAAIKEGVQVRRGTRARGWDRTSAGELCVPLGEEEAIVAPRLVLAIGRRPAAGPDSWIGWREATRCLPVTGGPDLEIVLGEGESYFGRARIDDGTVTTTHLARHAESVTPGFSGCLGTPRFHLGRARVESAPGIFHVGDAMAAWPPIVGDGITAALAGGARLGRRLADRNFDERGWRHDWQRHHGRALRSAMALHAILLRPALRRPLWRLARAWAGLAPLLEAQVKLASLSRPGVRAATKGRYIPAGS
ncbi:MAG: FAD-dependent oxidoreductase [Candidatus Eisenbacteria bacterium]|nr:FAD-dependent oxidoreductase [Candidatus Eisenbacteria bacterium]